VPPHESWHRRVDIAVAHVGVEGLDAATPVGIQDAREHPFADAVENAVLGDLAVMVRRDVTGALVKQVLGPVDAAVVGGGHRVSRVGTHGPQQTYRQRRGVESLPGHGGENDAHRGRPCLLFDEREQVQALPAPSRLCGYAETGALTTAWLVLTYAWRRATLALTFFSFISSLLP
jgi:hypothetical protein